MELKRKPESAVSPIVGVALMVALVLLLAGLVFTGVVDFTQRDINEQPSGTFNYDLELSGSDARIEITLTSGTRLDNARVSLNGNELGSFNSTEPGEKFIVDYGNIAKDIEEGDRVVIVGDYKGKEQVVSTYVVRG